MSKKTISDSWQRDFSFEQFKEDMSFSYERLHLHPYFWALLFLMGMSVFVESSVIIYQIFKLSFEGRGFLAFGMGVCLVLFFVFSSILFRGIALLLSIEKETEKRSVRSLIWGFCVMFLCGFVSYLVY